MLAGAADLTTPSATLCAVRSADTFTHYSTDMLLAAALELSASACHKSALTALSNLCAARYRCRPATKGSARWLLLLLVLLLPLFLLPLSLLACGSLELLLLLLPPPAAPLPPLLANCWSGAVAEPPSPIMLLALLLAPLTAAALPPKRSRCAVAAANERCRRMSRTCSACTCGAQQIPAPPFTITHGRKTRQRSEGNGLVSEVTFRII